MPPNSADLKIFWFCEAQRDFISRVNFELEAWPHVKTMSNEDHRRVAQPISHFYKRFSPSNSRALADYIPTRTALSLA